MTGVVKFFKADKGYGFIINDEDKKEYFVHFRDCADRIEGGYKVSFNLKDGKKGPMAINVIIIE
jgi:CspA family cold shock protein